MTRSLMALVALVLGVAAAQEPAVVVDIRDFSFEPHEVKMNAGTTVRWVNRDPAVHAIAMEGGRPGSSALLEPGREHTVNFREPGRYTYRCGVHPTMLGIIVVD